MVFQPGTRCHPSVVACRSLKEERMNPIRLLVILSLAWVALSGCASNRLKGPIHAADGPPWVAGDLSREIAPIDLQHRVLLIGDTGYFLEEDPTLAAVGRWSAGAPASSVLFLGDNVYNEGLVDDDRERGEAILAQLLESTQRRKIFLPGNHDWGFSPRGQNQQAILNQQAFVDTWPDGNAEFVPRDGCMGPVTRVLHEAAPGARDVVLIAMDPTPWINPLLRDACPTPETHDSYLALLEQELEAHAEDFVIVASHYPMRTGGPHGGLTYGVIGDMITGIIGWSWGGLMNTYEPNYADWIERTLAVFRKHPPLAYSAGHDHNLQLLDAEDFARIEIVSGAGARDRVSTVTHIPPTIFAHAAPGFVVLDFGMRDGEEVVVARIIETEIENPVFEMDVP
jgi:Calcineurin-like phosphoesterase